MLFLSALSSYAIFFIFNVQATTAQETNAGSSDTSCSRNEAREEALKHPNATGSYTKTPFSSAGASANSFILSNSWTYSTLITVQDEIVWQYFSIDTGVRGDEVPEDAPTVQLCSIAFHALPRSVYENGQDDAEGDCSTILTPECRDALQTLAARPGSGSDDRCSRLDFTSEALPECEGFASWGGATSLSVPLQADDDSSQGCRTGDNTTLTLFGIPVSAPDDRSTGFSDADYDEGIYRVVPFLSTITSPSTVSSGNEPFPSTTSVSKLLCMRARDVVAGSRVPQALSYSADTSLPAPSGTQADSESSAVRSQELTLAGILGIALVAFMLR
ncbi:MAG: hypothetical protein Q9185_006611 [Variospora sp. 1 TL-2023]